MDRSLQMTTCFVVIDDYSRFPEVEIVRSTSVRAIIPHLDAIFARQGIPEVAKSDNGPPFNAEDFKKWMKLIGCHHQKITPLWPRANGEAERFMRPIEKAIRAAVIDKEFWKKELYKFLRHYRATPHGTTGKSSGEMLYHWKIKTELPISPTQKKRVRFEDDPPDPIEQIRRSDQRMKQYIKELADERNHARENDLQPGDKVRVRQAKKDKLSPPFKPLPYEVKTRKGSMITAKHGNQEVTRNASFFKKISDGCAIQQQTHPHNTESEDDDLLHGDTLETENRPDLRVQEPVQGPRKTGRERSPLAHLNDFVR